MSEQKQRRYINRATLLKAHRTEKSGYKMLKLLFRGWDPEKKEEAFFNHALFLTEENNERNQQVFATLGCTPPPDVVNYDGVKEATGLGLRTVDLVLEENDAGYENVKFINEPKFGVTVFDME